MAKANKKPQKRPWEFDRSYKHPSFTAAKWAVIEHWLRRNRDLIKATGTLKAQYVARQPASKLSKELQNEGWQPLVGARPTKEQIEESIRIHRLL